MPPVLDVDNLALRFGSHLAVKGLSFTVNRGETVALVGESGSGKSATALAILRLIEREGGQLDGGRILLDGTPPLDLAALSDVQMRQVRGKRVSMIFQEPMTALNPVMTLGDQVTEVLSLHQGINRQAAQRAAKEALDQVRIPEPGRRMTQYPHELSGGLRQRVMIAMALACRPDLLIADEPTTALDVTTQAEILDLIRNLQTEIGMAMLFITHDMGVVAEIADRVVVLQQGEMVETGNAGDIFARPRADYTRKLMAATPRLGSGSPKPPPKSDAILDVRNLSVRFPVRRGLLPGNHLDYCAVNNVSLTIGRGETLGLVGESGCGKSTLARAVLRLVDPAAGTIRLDGQDITGLSSKQMQPLRSKAQMVFQDPFASLNPRRPVWDLITEPAQIAGHLGRKAAKAMAIDLLAKVGLEPQAADRYPHQFSGGQRQRLCIARALSVKPALIVADEAVSALDVSVARQVTDLMAQLQAEDGISFLFISHDIAVVERVSHRIAVMYAAQIVETGRTNHVLSNPMHSYTRRLLSAVPKPDPAMRGRRLQLTRMAKMPDLLFAPGAMPSRTTLTMVAPDHWVAEEKTVPVRPGAQRHGTAGKGPASELQMKAQPTAHVD